MRWYRTHSLWSLLEYFKIVDRPLPPPDPRCVIDHKRYYRDTPVPRKVK